MKITLGKDQVNLLNPPTHGDLVDEQGKVWRICFNYRGAVVLRAGNGAECHPDFVEGMDMQNFCWWINERLQ